MSSATADWDACGDTFYRKTKLYDAVFDDDLDLENHIIAGAPYSGAIGMTASLSIPQTILTSTERYFETRRSCNPIEAHKLQSPALTYILAQVN